MIPEGHLEKKILSTNKEGGTVRRRRRDFILLRTQGGCTTMLQSQEGGVGVGLREGDMG